MSPGHQILDCASFLGVMRLPIALRASVLMAAACVCVPAQNTPGTNAPSETKGLPPRAAPGDYQAQAHAGTVTIAAEFAGHSVPTLEGTLSTEDYVVVETGLFGSPGGRIKLSSDEFSLRINGNKTLLPSQPYGLVIASVKDPEWEPPASTSSKSKTSLNTGGKSDTNEPPPPVKIPIEVQRAMAQHVQKASLPEGDRALPVAGLLFFRYGGKTKNIRSMELIYAGSAGDATLALQP